MLTEGEKLKRLEHFMGVIEEEIIKRQQVINRFKDALKIGKDMIKEIIKGGINAKNKEYERLKKKIKDYKPDEYERKIKEICKKIKY